MLSQHTLVAVAGKVGEALLKVVGYITKMEGEDFVVRKKRGKAGGSKRNRMTASEDSDGEFLVQQTLWE